MSFGKAGMGEAVNSPTGYEMPVLTHIIDDSLYQVQDHQEGFRSSNPDLDILNL